MFKIGLLGASQIAPIAIITPAHEMANVSVSTVAARNQERARNYANEYNISQVFSTYEALISSPDVDIVYNGLPPAFHAQWSIRALQAGKHVICEKPIAMNTHEARLMVAAADANNRRLVEAFHTRYHPSFQVCLDWVKSSKIGDVQSMEAYFGLPLEDDGRRNQFRSEMGGGCMMDMGCYPLQWVDSFAFSDVAEIQARAEMAPSGVDETMNATLIYKNGVSAKIGCSMSTDREFSAHLTIVGTRGTIQFLNPLVPHENGTLQIIYDSGEIEVHEISHLPTYHCQLEAIIAALESGAPLPTEGTAIIRQQRLIDECYRAAGLEGLRTSLS